MSDLERFRKPQSGDKQISADLLRTMIREIIQQEIRVAAPLEAARVGGATCIHCARAYTAFFPAALNGSASDGTNRWKYGWYEIRKIGTLYTEWDTWSGARSGTTTNNPARNMFEVGNAASTLGDGTAVGTSGEATVSALAYPSGSLVMMFEVPCSASTRGSEMWFWPMPNGLTVECNP